MKKKYILFLVILVIIIFYNRAPMLSIKNNPYDLPALEPDHYLYLVEDNSGNQMYVLGSYHFGAIPTEIDGKLLEAYNDSSNIAFELDWGNSQADTFNSILTRNPASKIDDPKFLDVLHKIDNLYSNVNEKSFQYNSYLIYTASLQEIYDELKISQKYGVDLTLFTQAKQDKKEISVIETSDIIEKQFKDSVNNELPLIMYEEFLQKEELIQATINTFKDYASGTSLKELISNSDSAFIYNESLDIPSKFYRSDKEKQQWEYYRKSTIFDRNEYDYKKASEYIKRDDTLLVIGLAHLYGSNGILTQFEEDGYNVTKK